MFKNDVIICQTEIHISRKKEKSNARSRRFYFHSKFLIYHRYSGEYQIYSRSKLIRVRKNQGIQNLAIDHFNHTFYRWVKNLVRYGVAHESYS